MNTFDQMIKRGHELVSFHQDEASDLRAIIAVHSTVLGPGFGGARRWHYATEADALYDVLRLSEGMTYKAAAAQMPVGGGKAVILLSRAGHAPTETEARALGRFVEKLGGLYVSAEDVGLSPQYVDWMAQETRYVSGGETACAGGDPSPFTAQGVVNAMRAALAHTGRPVSFDGLHIAIQGAGRVGSHVARIVSGLGARVTAADIDEGAVRRLADEIGAAIALPEEILTTECDILAPCALGGVIDSTVIRRLRTGIICGGANNILADYDADGRALAARGIVYVPDFVANAGGLIELAGVYVGMEERERRKRISDIEATTAAILRSAESDTSTFAAAVAHARSVLANGAISGVEGGMQRGGSHPPHSKEQVHAR